MQSPYPQLSLIMRIDQQRPGTRPIITTAPQYQSVLQRLLVGG